MNNLNCTPQSTDNTSGKTQTSKQSALLICPTFFNYYKNICSEFESIGFNAFWLNTRLFENSVYKLFLRVMPNLVSRLSTARYIKRIQMMELQNVAEVLVVKGEGISPNAVTFLRVLFPQARIRLYLWDGIENTPHIRHLANKFDTVATFDPQDSQKFGWQYRPLFARQIKNEPIISSRIYSYDWIFIGSLHSDRFKVLRRLVYSTKHFRSFVFGYIPGKLVWWLRHFVNISLWRPGPIVLSVIPLDSKQANDIVESSHAVLDIEHPNQRGLTMRSIETLMYGRKLITTNAEIKNSDLYDETRVCVIDRHNPTIPDDFLCSSFNSVDSKLREKYSINGWLNEILENPEIQNEC